VKRRRMERSHPGEPEGQTSVNELLDDTVGPEPIQMVLPIHIQLPNGQIRRPWAPKITTVVWGRFMAAPTWIESGQAEPAAL
jgi:hypothetical protein